MVTKVKEKVTRVKCTKAKVKVKARTKARTSEKNSDLKVKAKVKEKALVKAEVEETGKVEVEASEVTKAEVKEEEKVFAGSKEKVKARHKQLQEFATIVTSMDTLKAQCRQKQRDMGYQARNVDLENQSEQASTTGTSTTSPFLRKPSYKPKPRKPRNTKSQ